MKYLKLIVLIGFFLGLLTTFAPAKAQDGAWASLANPTPQGVFQIRNNTSFMIWVRNNDGSPNGNGIPAGEVSSGRLQLTGQWATNMSAFCAENPGSDFTFGMSFRDESGVRNDSTMRFPCAVVNGGGNSTGGNTSSGGSSNSSSNSGGNCVSPSGGSVNIRPNPNTSQNAIGVLNVGDCLPYVGTAANGWYQVQLSNGSTGYVSNQYARYGGSSTSNGGGNSQTSGVCGSLESFDGGRVLVLNRPGWLTDPVGVNATVRENVTSDGPRNPSWWNAPVLMAFVSGSEMQVVSTFARTEANGVSFGGMLDGGCIYPANHIGGTFVRVALVANNSQGTLWHELAHTHGAGHGPACHSSVARNMALPRSSDACAFNNSITGQ